MSDEDERIRLVCPNCDHPIVTVPPNHRFPEDLICPGCGAQLEPPHLNKKWLAKAKDQVNRFLDHKDKS